MFLSLAISLTISLPRDYKGRTQEYVFICDFKCCSRENVRLSGTPLRELRFTPATIRGSRPVFKQVQPPYVSISSFFALVHATVEFLSIAWQNV